MTYVAFANEGDFRAWHDAKCQEHGIPHPGFVDGVAEPQMYDQWTLAFTATFLIDGQICVSGSDEYIAADQVLKQLPVVEVVVNENGTTTPPVDIVDLGTEKGIPPTWTDPNTDITYEVPAEVQSGGRASKPVTKAAKARKARK
jgi:hypothetical protein